MELKLSNVIDTGLFDGFSILQSLNLGSEITRGGYGAIFRCNSINGKPFTIPLIIKLFHNNGNSFEHSYKTICRLQKVLRAKNEELKKVGSSLFHEYIGLLAAPLFSFAGTNGNETYYGYAAFDLKTFGLMSLEDLFGEYCEKNNYSYIEEQSIEQRLSRAYNLAKTFHFFKTINYIHADLTDDNLFIDLNNGMCVVIDYDSGTLVEAINDIPKTSGKTKDWIAPEIHFSRKEKSEIKLSSNSDWWSVSVGIHYLFFGCGPLFYLKDMSKTVLTDYASICKWPFIDKNSPLFNTLEPNNTNYDFFIEEDVKTLPKELYESFEYTFSDGLLNPDSRTNVGQWTIRLSPFAKKGAFHSFLENLQSTINQNNGHVSLLNNPQEEYFSIDINSLRNLPLKEVVPYAMMDMILNNLNTNKYYDLFEEKCNFEGINKRDFFDGVLRFLNAYRDAIHDKVITQSEYNNLANNLIEPAFLSLDFLEEMLRPFKCEFIPKQR